MSAESGSVRQPGRLAEVIEALIYILCQAAELEHGIMAQYLFAAFSLKQSTAEGLTGAEADVVQRRRKQIMHIAAQEMLHLALVQNLPAAVQLMLLPSGEQALRHFMFLERPLPRWDWGASGPPAPVAAEAEQPAALAARAG